MAEHGYWTRKQMTRRQLVRALSLGAGALGALSLISCSDDDDDEPTSATGNTGGGTPVAGGKLNWQAYGHPGTFDLFASGAGANVAGLVHSSLLAFNYGHPPANGVDVDVEPDLAQSLPEQAPDGVTYSFKLKDATFHSGRAVTAEDVKYSYELYSGADSIYAGDWFWFDKVEAPDPKTIVVTTKAPYADALLQMASFTSGFIHAKEFQEGPDAASKMMGSGPYLFDSSASGGDTIFKKNPNYYGGPLPHYDEIVSLAASDAAKQVADFSAKNTQYTYWFSEIARDQIKQNRPDAIVWSYPYASFLAFWRTDQAPFNDKRVRQALSMAVNREAIRESVSKGEGEADNVTSAAFGPKWGFRKPEDLGASAKNWVYDLTAAKQLLSAAGITSPIEATWSHLDASLRGPIDSDLSTLTQAGWKQGGIANITDKPLTPGQYFTTVGIGDFDGIAVGAGLQYPDVGTQLKNYLSGGLTAPTLNWSRVDDSALNELFEKQLGQLDFEERKATYEEIEELLADNMYVLPWSTTSHTHFTDPSVAGAIVPVYAYGGNAQYIKNWGMKQA
jgi:ABC-type transport system substrate-binding protein